MKKASSDRWSGRPSGASARRGRRASRRFPALARSGPRPGAVSGAAHDWLRRLNVPSRSVSIPARQGSESLPRSKRNVVLYPLSHAPDLLDQVGQVGAVLDEIDVRAVDHEKRGLRVMVEVLPERLREPLQVLRSHAALELAGALAEPAEQHLRSGLEVDDEVWPRKPLVEQLEYPLIELELVGVERERREDRVLGEEVIGDGPAPEE